MSYTSTAASQDFVLNSLGFAFIGWTLQILVYGACIQLAGPQIHKHLARKRFLLVLATVLFLVTMISGITAWNIFHWGTLQQRDEKSVAAFTYPSAIAPIPTGILAFIVQSYFAMRAWRVVNKSKYFLAYIAFLTIAALGGALGRSAALLQGIAGYGNPWTMLATSMTWNFGSALADLSISCVLITGLAKQKTGLKTPTDNIVTKLMHLAVETAALPTFFASASAIAAIAGRGTHRSGLYCMFILPLPSIYTFTFLWCLNSLDKVRQRREEEEFGGGCARCHGWLGVAQVQVPAMTENPAGSVEVSHQTRRSTSIVDFFQALHRGPARTAQAAGEALDAMLPSLAKTGEASPDMMDDQDKGKGSPIL